MSRTDLMPMIRGTVAALRCRELAVSGALGEARVELSLLRSAIQELAERHADQLAADLAILRAREQTLAALLATPPAAPSARQRIKPANVEGAFRFAPLRGNIEVGGQVRTRNHTPAVNEAAESGGQQPSSRRQPSSRTHAMLLVDRGNGEEQVRMLDFLRDHVDDADVFEQVGALKVGQTVEIAGGGAPAIAVRRIQ